MKTSNKKISKFVLPILVILVLFFIYVSYFAPTDELGSWSSFDTNSNANRDIIVKLVKEKGFIKDQSSGSTILYALDKFDREVKVMAPLSLPPGLDQVKTVVLRGHLHTDYFHAVDVVPR